MDEYCMYLRKSRLDVEAEKRGEGETLERHKRMLIELANHHNITITGIYQEVVSGETIASRPEMQRLLQDIEQGMWSGIFAVEVERLARGDTIDQGIVAQTFKYSDTKIYTPMRVYDPNNESDEEYFEFGLFMSRREYKTINRRLQAGRLAAVKEGKYPGNHAPYGYERIKIKGEQGFTLKPIKEQSDIVKLIFEWYTLGILQDDGSRERIGTTLIARKLNSMKVLPQKGNHWVSASIRDLLRNHHYCGMVRWNWRPAKKKTLDGNRIIERPRNDNLVVVKGRHEAIINKDVFDMAQVLLSNNPPRPVNERYIVKNPLSGLIECGKCGKRMARRPYGKTGYPDTLLCQDLECKNVSSHLSLVEARLLAGLAEWLAGYKLQWETGKSSNKKGMSQRDIIIKSINKLSGELEKLDKRKNSVYEFYEDGKYTSEEFLERTQKITEQIQTVQNDRATLESELKRMTAREVALEQVIPTVERLLDVYHTLDSPGAKNDLLKEVLEKAVYTKEKGGRWHNSPDNFELILYPILPASQ